jgi:putative transposase
MFMVSGLIYAVRGEDYPLEVANPSNAKRSKTDLRSKHLYFVTFSCYGRRPLLATPQARDVFVTALAVIRSRYRFQVIGYVVMPEHVHLLISEPSDCTASTVLRILKQRVARVLRNPRPSDSALGPSPSWVDRRDTLPTFWQPRFYDFNVFTFKKKKEKLAYMHANPVKRGLAANPSGCIWSSSSLYEQGIPGRVPIDPAD